MSRINNFDAIRLIAAVVVVIGHAWPLTGVPNAPSVATIPIHGLAVFVFFSLSGYLITQSWLITPSVPRFLAARVLRIFPALVAFVIVALLVIGPLVTSLSASAYFTDPGTRRFVRNLLLLPVYDLPGVFTGQPFTAVNGVLWTLGPEFVCYLAVLALGILFARFAIARAVLLTAGLAVIAVISTGSTHMMAEAMVFFGVGSVIASVARMRTLPLWPALVAIPVWILVGTLIPEVAVYAAWIAVPYIVIALGQRPTPVLRRGGRFGDLSYGTYLWGFPVQQVVIHVFGYLPFIVNLVLVLTVTLVIAWLSWHGIEKHALALKKRVGRRRVVPVLA